MQEAQGVTIDTGEVKPEKKLKTYSSSLTVLGLHNIRVYTDNSIDEILHTASIDELLLTPREQNYLYGYLRFVGMIRKTKRTLPPTKKEAQGDDYKFNGPDKACYKPMQSLIKKGILKEVSWLVRDKYNPKGSLRTFVALTPAGRKFIDEKIFSAPTKEADSSVGDIPQNGESSDSNPV